MTEKIETKTITSTIFIANDGTKFSNKNTCIFYEWKQTATKLYLAGRRGSRFEEAEVYSTKELAELYKADFDNIIIKEIYLDERQYLLQLKDY